jgi:hypothetical protein
MRGLLGAFWKQPTRQVATNCPKMAPKSYPFEAGELPVSLTASGSGAVIAFASLTSPSVTDFDLTEPRL